MRPPAHLPGDIASSSRPKNPNVRTIVPVTFHANDRRSVTGLNFQLDRWMTYDVPRCTGTNPLNQRSIPLATENSIGGTMATTRVAVAKDDHMAGTSDFGTWGRYTEIPVKKMTADQKRAYEFTMKSRGQVPGPYKIWLQNPKLMEVMVPLGAYYQGHSSLSTR